MAADPPKTKQKNDPGRRRTGTTGGGGHCGSGLCRLSALLLATADQPSFRVEVCGEKLIVNVIPHIHQAAGSHVPRCACIFLEGSHACPEEPPATAAVENSQREAM